MENLGPSLIPSAKPQLLPLPGGGSNLPGFLSPGRNQGGASGTNRNFAVQPRAQGFNTPRGPGVTSWMQPRKPTGQGDAARQGAQQPQPGSPFFLPLLVRMLQGQPWLQSHGGRKPALRK